MRAGRIWKFGDDINTDLMLPGPLLTASEAEQARAVFSANRPGWVDQIAPGDIIVGGRNFGTGSSRPAARSLRNIGLGALLAESINGLFFRNAVSFGFLALECPGVHAAFEEAQTAEISIAQLDCAQPRYRRGIARQPGAGAVAGADDRGRHLSAARSRGSDRPESRGLTRELCFGCEALSVSGAAGSG